MKLKMIQMMTLLALVVSSAFAADVDLKNSSLTWRGSKVTGKHHGKVPLKSGSVEFKNGKIASGNFVADLSAFTIEDLKGEWAGKFIKHMKSEDFFEVSKYPTAKLKIKSVKKNKAIADLTVKGKTNEVKFDIKETKGVYSGVLKFDRTKFDMIYGSKNFFKSIGDKAIDNEVKVEFSFKLIAKKDK